MSNVLSTNEVAKNKVPDLLKDTLTVTGIIKDGIIDFAVLASDNVKALLKGSAKPLQAFIEAVDGKDWQQISGKMLGATIDVFAFTKLLKFSSNKEYFIGAGASSGAFVADKLDFSFADYSEKAFPAAAKFWEKLSSDEEYANQVLDGLKKVADEKQFTNYYKNTTIEKFLSDFKELLTPLDPKDLISDTANAYKDKQYVDFAGALKYFNEDGTVNFAKYLADTANISLYDPIALDLNANGKIDTLSLENGVFFDHNGDEIAFKSSWVNSSDGILARDINGDGKITSGAELFGNFTKLKNGELAKNGAQALKDLDDNNDGIFDSNDKAFNEILVWQDKNSDGISQKNELKTLNEHNIKSIDLEFMADNTALDKDNKQILIGSFSTNISNESKNNLASDIDFSVDTIQRNILDDTDGIIKGTGFVRNFNLSLNDEIKNAYESYKTLNTKQQQLSNVETLVNLWAKTAKQYNEIQNPIQKAKINISSVASGTTSSGIDEAIKRANNNEITINDEILSNEGNIITSNENAPNSKSLTPGQALALYEFKISDTDSAKIKELATKAAVVSVFSGKENKVLYVSNNEEVKSAIQSIEKAYDSIISYVYKSLLVSTRLDKYAKNIEVNMALNDDDTYEFALNFDKVAMQFKENLQTSAADALIDYIEFNAIYNDKNLKKAVESMLIKQAIENKEFLESLALLDEEQKSIILNTTQKILAQNIVTDTEYLTQITNNLNIKILKAGDDNSRLNGLYSNDVLLGGNGKDYLYGENGDDILIGGSGNDYLNGSRGNDTYVFGKNWGVDSIYNYDSYRINDDSKDIIEFKDGIKLSDLSFSSNSNYDLIITQGNNKIIAEYALGDNYYKIDKVRFDDNTELSFADLRKLVLQGKDSTKNLYGFMDVENTVNAGSVNNYVYGNSKDDILNGEDGDDRIYGGNGNDTLDGGNGKDYLYGENGDDILIGGSGNDYLNGSRGNDTYVFGKNWGVDSIYNYDSYRINDDSKDIIEFKDGIKLSDLSFSSNSNYDLIITQGNNKIIAEYALGDNYYKIDKVRFDDNTELDFEQIKLLSALASKNADII